MKKIATAVSNICNAGNKEEFADVILSALENEFSNEELRTRLFIIARKIGVTWTAAQKRKLAMLCMGQIAPELYGMGTSGAKVSTNIQALYTLSICANENQLAELSVLHDSSKYLQACLYMHAKTRSALEWLQEEFEKDAKQAAKRLGSNIQSSAYAIGVALRKEGDSIIPPKKEKKIVERLCSVIRTGNLSQEQLICCILALACICDQRQQSSELENKLICEVLDTINNIEDFYSVLIRMGAEKAKEVSVKMINGDLLSEEEEQFLLTKLER